VAVAIRPATVEDARAMAEVHVASWRWAYRSIVPTEVLDGLSVGERADMWASILERPQERSCVFVATDTGAVVGFASAGPSGEPDAPVNTAEVFTLYLLEHVVGRGIGREMFATLVGTIRGQGYARAELWVLEANARARRFYEAAGWRDDGGRDSYRVSGVDYPEVRYAVDL